jgi:hypothetical protein
MEFNSGWCQSYRDLHPRLLPSWNYLSGTFRISDTTWKKSCFYENGSILTPITWTRCQKRWKMYTFFSIRKQVMNISYMEVNPLQNVCIWTEVIRPTGKPITCHVTCDTPSNSVSTCRFVGLKSWNGFPELDRLSRINWISGERKHASIKGVTNIQLCKTCVLLRVTHLVRDGFGQETESVISFWNLVENVYRHLSPSAVRVRIITHLINKGIGVWSLERKAKGKESGKFAENRTLFQWRFIYHKIHTVMTLKRVIWLDEFPWAGGNCRVGDAYDEECFISNN